MEFGLESRAIPSRTLLRSEDRPPDLQRASDRIRILRRTRPERRLQRAPFLRHACPNPRRCTPPSSPARRKGADPAARHSDRPPAGSRARRRRDRHDRLHLRRTARGGARQGVALRDLAQQCQSDALHGPVLGGARPHPEGLATRDGPFNFEGEFHHYRRSVSGRHLSAAAPAGLDHGGQPRIDPRDRDPRPQPRGVPRGTEPQEAHGPLQAADPGARASRGGPREVRLSMPRRRRTHGRGGHRRATRFRATCARPRSWAKPS